jgi:hypothetical protein
MQQQHQQEVNRTKELNQKQLTCLQPKTEKYSNHLEAKLAYHGRQRGNEAICRRPS